jgi:DNA polymerase-3 subunit delta'
MNPALWAGVVGQDEAVARLTEAARDPVHAYLLLGPAGSGKRAAARAFGAALLCPFGGDGTCRDCRLALAGEHPDVREVERVGAAISVAQADEIVRLASLTPVEGARKVLVLSEFHLVQAPAAARLLKTLEEPPDGTFFVVLADEVPLELVTIASRCVRVLFRSLADEVIAAALVAEGLDARTATETAEWAHGSLDRARLLAADSGTAARRGAFHGLPRRLDGTGAVVATVVDELLALIDAAALPLRERQASELAAFDAQAAQTGERRADRRVVEERHKRELRRQRTDELRFGLAAVASAYRDRLVEGTAPDTQAAISAVHAVHESLEALERNPNERLLLEWLLVRLPAL